ncbi:hypothetical protein ACF0H5_009934 [Mactra antiquata]
MAIVWTFLIVLVLGGSQYVEGYTSADMNTHFGAIFTDYDTRVRPKTDQTQAIEVTVDLYLLGINNFDNSEQKLETTAYLEIKWIDQVLSAGSKWTNGDISEVLVPQNEVWLPDLALQNGFESLSGLGTKFHKVKIEQNGQATWRPYHVFESSCTVDVTYFPFDKTTCDLKFVVWSNPVSLLLAKQGTTGVDISLYSPNSEWTLVSTKAVDFSSSTESGVTFSIEIKRKPLFYLLNILVPVVMLALLNAFVFALPAASGEKTGFAVTAFLAFAVFLTIISAELPQNSEKISTFAAYLFLMTFVSTLIALITIVELRLASRDHDVPVPEGLQRITKCVRRMTRWNCCQNTIGYVRGIKLVEMKRHLSTDVSWEDAVDSLDFILFWVFFLIITIITVACFVIAALGALS